VFGYPQLSLNTTLIAWWFVPRHSRPKTLDRHGFVTKSCISEISWVNSLLGKQIHSLMSRSSAYLEHAPFEKCTDWIVVVY
jgi:hypothetical protein